MEVPVELFRIVISETSPKQFIFLKETNGQRSFPIVIGISEALAIDRRLKGIEMPRPMTHDLLAQTIEALGGRLVRVVVTDLREQTFVASLFIEHDGDTLEVDARPSDAIALAVGYRTPLFVAEEVMEKVQADPLDLASQRESLQCRRDELVETIGQMQEQMDSQDFRQAATEEQMRVLKGQLQEMQVELDAIEEILRHLSQEPE